MNDRQNTPGRVAVVGGGISGLAAAHRLIELDPSCNLTLLEAGSRLGGALWTIHEEGFQVEQGVDNFITTLPWGVDLCRRLGLEDQLVRTSPEYRQTFVARAGRLHKLPEGFLMMAPTRIWPLALTPLLSLRGKLRCGLEYFLPPRGDDADESMASFVRRRLGREAYERLVEPLVGAVYAADLEKLSVNATLSRFRQMEREQGSLIRAMRRQMAARRQGETQSGARFSMFVTLRRGLSSLVDAIAGGLPQGSVRLKSAVERIERQGDRWRVWPATPGRTDVRSAPVPQCRAEVFQAVIFAAPAHVGARVLGAVDAEMAAMLGTIEHSSTAVLTFGYRREQIAHPLDGMGIVVPAVERSPILACSLSSRKYVHRAPEGKVLLRVFVGGARFPELAAMDEAELRPRILDELAALLGIRGEPVYSRIARWPRSMPQYHVGHQQLIARIAARAAALPNFELCGNAYQGVGIPDCIHGGQQAAERLLGACD